MKERKGDSTSVRQDDGDRGRTISPPKTRQRSRSPRTDSPTETERPAQKRQKKQENIYTTSFIHIKSEPESSQSSSDEAEDSGSESEYCLRSSSSSGSSSSINIFLQARKDLFNSGIPSHPKVDDIFCYNCKNFGHPRNSCTNRWYHWWPQEYLSRYSWLKRRVHETNPLRKAGKTSEFRQAMIKIDADVEREDRKLNGKEVAQTQRYFFDPTQQSRVDGQRILHAMRRVTPTPSPPPSICQGESCHFSFEKRVEQLERQIEQLRLQLSLVPRSALSAALTS